MAYFLILEKRPGDFMPINISILNGNTYTDYSLIENIDQFTKDLTKEEIITLVKNNNIVSPEYLEGSLWVINEKKYRFGVLTKDINMSLDTFFLKYINDKRIMNKFVNIYLKYSKDNIDNIKKAIEDKKVDVILQNLFMLSYDKVRSIYFYLYEKVVEEKTE